MTTRINLQKTKYKIIPHKILSSKHFLECEQIYKEYILYKKFDELYPIFREDYESAGGVGY